MGQEHIEEYLGAIYRLRESAAVPLPLVQLQEHFGFSPISIHEMVQKLESLELITYLPYRGVILSPHGEAVASALVRRHRIWERFLTDFLDLPWDTAHQVAGQLEHSAPEIVTERLADLLGKPDSCPHGAKIPPAQTAEPVNLSTAQSIRLADSGPGKTYQVCCISPEIPDFLKSLKEWEIQPGSVLRLLQSKNDCHEIETQNHFIDIPNLLAQTIRVIEVA